MGIVCGQSSANRKTPYSSLYFLSSLFHFSRSFRIIPKIATPRDRRAAPPIVPTCRGSLPEAPSYRSPAPITRQTTPKMRPVTPCCIDLPSSSGGLRSQFSTGPKEADKFIIRVKQSKTGWVIRFLHFRAAATSGVCAGFERCFGYHDFRTASTILAVVDLAFGHGT